MESPQKCFGNICPMAQSCDQGPFKSAKVESTHNVLATFAGLKA